MLNKKVKLSIVLIGLVSAAFIATGCASNKAVVNEGSAEAAPSDKIQVIATLFPQYDFTKAVAGDKADVRLLMPPGTESHSYDPTPKDIVDIQSADVFIYTSVAMEPWVEELLKKIGPETLVVDATKGVTYYTAEQIGIAPLESDGHSDNASGVDPHVWLDPANAGIMAKNVAEALETVLPEEKTYFDDRLAAYQKELTDLDSKIQTTLDKYPNRSIVFAGHYAFGYFTKKYNLSYHSPYAGFSPDTEPSPQKIAEMVDFMKSENQKVVYYEELIDPKIARVIADESSAKLLMLHAAHNVSKDDLANGLTYISIMTSNLEKLEEGLK